MAARQRPLYCGIRAYNHFLTARWSASLSFAHMSVYRQTGWPGFSSKIDSTVISDSATVWSCTVFVEFRAYDHLLYKLHVLANWRIELIGRLHRITSPRLPAYTRGLSLDITGRHKKSMGSSPTFTSFHIFPTGNTRFSLNIWSQRILRMHNQ